MYTEIKQQQPRILITNRANETPANIDIFKKNKEYLENQNKRCFQHKFILEKAKKKYLKIFK